MRHLSQQGRASPPLQQAGRPAGAGAYMYRSPTRTGAPGAPICPGKRYCSREKLAATPPSHALAAGRRGDGSMARCTRRAEPRRPTHWAATAMPA